MGLLDKLKKLLTGSGSSSKIREANRVTNYGGGVSKTNTKSFKSAYTKKKKDEEEKTRQVANAFKATTPKAQKTAEGVAQTVKKQKPDAFNKANAFKASSSTTTTKKATPPATRYGSTALGTMSQKDIASRTAKRNAYQANRKEQSRAADRLKTTIDAKYNTSTMEGRRRIKSGEYQSDSNVAKYEVLKHPVTTSAARGALSGTTFGLSDLAASKLTKGEAREAERFYQANKSKGAEFAGEMAGSLASFGITGGLSRDAIANVAPKTTARLGEGATELLAKNGLVRRAAEREAVRKLGITATKEEVERFAKARAAKLVQAVGEDAAINLTTGAVSDVTHALIDSDDPVEFAKNMAINAGMNWALGGLTTVAPALYGGSALDESIRAMGSDVSDFGRDVARNMDNRSGGIKLGSDAPKKADEIFESSKHKQKKTDWAIGKDDTGVLWVGDPKDVSKRQYFGRDIPENRAKAQEEFDFFSSKKTTTAQQKIAEEAEAKAARSARAKKAAAAKKEAESRGLKYYSDDDLVKMLKKDGNFRKLTNEEYLYYIYNRADDDPFIARIDEIYDNIDNTSKAKASEQKASAVAEAPANKAPAAKAKETKVKEVKAKKTKSEPVKSTKADTAAKKTPSNKTAKTQNSATKEAVNEQADTYSIKKSSLEYKKRNVEKMLKKVENEVAEKSKYASQKEMSALNSKYMSLLETKKKLEAQIEEASKSADGRITLNKRNRQAKPQIEEPEVRISKLEPEKTVEPTAKTKGKKSDVDALSTYKQNRLKENPDAKFAETKKTTAKSNKTEGKKKYDVQVEDSKGKLHETTVEVSSSSEARRKGASKVQDSLEHDVEVKDAKTLGREEKAQKAKGEKKQGSAKNNKPSDVKESAKKTEKPMSKAAEARAKKAEARQRLDSLLETAEKHQAAYESGDSNALKELVATEKEVKQAYRDAGMSRSDAYKESKKLFDEHEKALKKAEKTNAKTAPKEEIFGKDKEGWTWGKTKEGDLFVGTDANREYFKDTPDNRTIVENYWKTNSFAGEEKAVKEAVAEKPPKKTKTEKKKGAKSAAETLKSKAENTDVLATYKKNQKASIEQAKAEEPSTVNIGSKTYSAVDESPFDEASTRTKREKPKFTSKEEAGKGATAKNKERIKEAKGKAKKQEQKFRRNPLPRGEALHKGTVKEVTGKELDEAINPPSAEDYIKSRRTYARGQASHEAEVVSRAGTSLTNATTAESQREFLENGWRDGLFNYRRIKNKEKYAQVMKRFVDEPDAVSREIIRYNNDLSSLSADKVVDTHYQAHCVMKMLRKELDNPALTAEEKAAVKDLYSCAASLSQKLSSMSGQVNQFQGVMVGCSPARRADNAIDNIVNILDSSKGFRKKQKIEIDGKTVALSDNTAERRQQIRALVLDNEDIAKDLKKVYDATTAEEYGEAMSELMLSTYKLNHATGFDYLQQWRYLAMLGNPKTHLRNLIGNTTFGALRQASNAIRSVEEKALGGYAAKKGLDIDYHGGLSFSAPMQARSRKLAKDEASKAAWDAFDKHKTEILGQNKYDTPEMAQFFGALSRGNTKLLGWEDDIFRAPAYREQYIKSYRKFAKKGEITEAILDRIHNEALKESRIATFNEFNELAQVLAKSQRGLYDYNASTGQKAVAHLSNALLPFTKVPANILKQSVNYSPAGVAKAVAHIKDAASRGDSELFNTALDELASGITGTGIAALGYFFGKNTDIFTTNAGSEDAAAKFKKQQGVQNYSATANIDGKTYSFTLDWMVPASCTFFTGVELAKQLEKGASGSSLWDSIGNISQVTSRVIDPVLETSMLSGIYNIVENSRKSSSYDDQKSFADIAMREIVQSYVSSYIPTLQGQIARTAYDADKMVVGEGDWDYFVNSLKVKMGLANVDTLKWGALGDDVNAYGEVKNKKTSPADYAKSFVKNAILPTNIQEVNLTDVDKQKIKEYEDYVASGGDPTDKDYLFPKKSYKTKFSYGKKGADPVDVKLSNKDVSLYNQAKTTGGAEAMRVVLEGAMFNHYEKDSSGKRTILKNGYDAEQKEKLIRKFDGKSMREVEEWLYKQPQFRSATVEEQRRVLNHLWSYSSNGASTGAKRVGEQAVVKAQGGDVNEYNFKNELSKTKQNNLKDAVDSGIVTYEEAVDFARNAGKTYYYDNDEGGTSSTYYNKKQMLEYLEAKGYSPEKAEALFNAFKASNAKPYGAPSGRGYYRRGYRGWRRRGGGGGKGKAVAHDASAFKAKNNNVTAKKVATPNSSPSAGKSTANAGKTSTNVSRTRRTTGATPTVKIPLNIKTVKPSKSTGKVKRTNLQVALDDIQKTQKKVAPPKARSSK